MTLRHRMTNTDHVAGSDRAGAPAAAGKAVVTAGSILAAIGAASCCVVPFALVTLGVSGAWIGNLTALAPYQPYFIAATLALLGCGFWLVYRKPKAACAEGSYCARPASDRIAKIGLWIAAALITAALAFPYAANRLFDL